MADYTDFIRNNIAPYAAKQIGVYKSDGTRVGTIPLGNFKPDYGERLYRFGLLSDVHNESSQTTENATDFKNALKELNDKESIEFICITGDLTQYSYSTQNIATEMALYQQNLSDAGVSKPVYVTTGNHDCPNSSDVDYTTFYQYAGLSDIAPSSGATASYEVTKTHTTSDGTVITDHFLFLTMRRYEFTSSTYYDDDITWLGNKLEEYKTDRCFVFTHMFFPTYSGNLNDIYPSGNWLSGDQLTNLKALIDAYPRSIWFSGHSHWKWYLQKYQDRANVYPTTNISRTTGWAVHLPSCASPIDSDGSSRTSMPLQSEGGVIDVYEDHVDIRAIEFKGADDSDYNFKYIPVAQYRLYTDADVLPAVTYTVTYKLNGVTSSCSDATATSKSGYATSLSTESGYKITSLTVTIGGTDVTSTYLDDSHISIPTVSGDIVITAVAEASDYTVTYNLNNSTITNNVGGVNSGDAYNAEVTHMEGYLVSGITVTMGGTDVTSTYVTDSTTISDKTIAITSVTGDIVITVTTAVAYNTIAVKCDTRSAGVAIMVPDETYKYFKYDAIKITVGGEDVTSTVTSVAATSSNSYKVGAYNLNSQYQYVPAGTVMTITVNTNTGTTTQAQIPLVQASSSSSCTGTPVYVQVKGMKYSNNQVDWIEVNNGSTILNGSEWGKNDLSWGWFEDIVDDPTTLTLSTDGTNS